MTSWLPGAIEAGAAIIGSRTVTRGKIAAKLIELRPKNVMQRVLKVSFSSRTIEKILLETVKLATRSPFPESFF